MSFLRDSASKTCKRDPACVKFITSFDSISKKLDALYTKALDAGDASEHVLAAILAIWSRCCADKILKDRLVETGLLKKVLPLLSRNQTRFAALSIVSLVSHHGGDASRVEVARTFCPALVAEMRAHPDDPRVLEPAIAAMSHALMSSITGSDDGTPPDQAVLKQIGIKDVLQATVDAVRSPSASLYLVNHALELFASVTFYCQKECRQVTDVLPLLAGFLRSSDAANAARLLPP